MRRTNKNARNTLKTHIRGRYHQFRSGGWTSEEDKELRALVVAYPNKWKLISTIIGDRSPQDCLNRSRDYLECSQRNTSTWSQEEEELLIRAVNTLAQRDEDHRAETGQPPLAEYTRRNISTLAISKEMGGVRNRVQITHKWKQWEEKHPDRTRVTVEYRPR